MATEKKLDCVILGLLNHEELTGYEIKKRMDTALRYFWGASYGSIYPTLTELVNRGFAQKRDETQNNRNKIIYTITESGREYLRNWLTLPVEKDELRYETLLKLFFGAEAGVSEALQHIEAFRQKTQEELQNLMAAAETLQKVKREDPAHRYYLLTADFGIKTYQAYLEWCQEAVKELKDLQGEGKG